MFPLLFFLCLSHAALFNVDKSFGTLATLVPRSSIKDLGVDPDVRDGLTILNKNLIAASEILDLKPFTRVMKSLLQLIKEVDETAKLVPGRISFLEADTTNPLNPINCLPFGTFNRTHLTLRRTKYDFTKIVSILPEELDPNPEDVASRKNQSVGAGITGTVYKGKWKGVPVAVKVFFLKVDTDIRAGAMEVLLMHGLLHPNTLSLYGAYATAHVEYLVMEYAGMTLFSALSKKQITLDWRDRIKFLMQVASALSYLHSFDPPVVHADLRATNVILTNEQNQRNVRLIDFGFAFGLPPNWKRGYAGRRTAPEMVGLGQYYFQLPAEYYAFAFLMWEVLTRELPWEEYSHLSTSEIEQLVTKGARPRLPDMIDNPSMQGVPEGYLELMNLCWVQDPSLRPTLPQILVRLGALQQVCSLYETNGLLLDGFLSDNLTPCSG